MNITCSTVLVLEGLATSAWEPEGGADGEASAETLLRAHARWRERVEALRRTGRRARVLPLHEVVHLGNRQVARLIANGGQALSEIEQRREDERVNDLVGQIERGAPPAPAHSASGVAVVRVPLLSTGWFAAYRRMADFSSIRRERLRGRAVAQAS